MYLSVHAMAQIRAGASPCAEFRLKTTFCSVLHKQSIENLSKGMLFVGYLNEKIDLLVLDNHREIICMSYLNFTSAVSWAVAVPLVVPVLSLLVCSACLAFSFLGSPFASLGNGSRPDVQLVLLTSFCMSLMYLCQKPLQYRTEMRIDTFNLAHTSIQFQLPFDMSEVFQSCNLNN